MRLLFVVHNLPPAESTGSPLQTDGYARAFAAMGHEVTVATVDDRIGRPDVAEVRRHPNGNYAIATFAGTAARWAEWSQSDWTTAERNPGARDRPFRKLLAKVRPDLVHVIDLVHLPSEWPRVAASLGIPVVRTFCNAEDLCGLIEPVHAGDGRCPTPIVPGDCAVHCIRRRPVELSQMTTLLGDLEQRVAAWLEQGTRDLAPQLERKRTALLHDLNHTYAATVFATAAWRNFFALSVPLEADRTHVIPLGTQTVDVAAPVPDVARPVVFGFLAPPNHNKGLDVLVKAVEDPRIADRTDVRVVLWGVWPADEHGVAARLDAMAHVTVRGAYTAAQLPAVLAELDVGLSISRFESFHRVTREVLGAGRAVIGTDAPGIGEIVEHERNGLAIPAGDAEALIQAMLRFLDDRELLARCQSGAASTHVATASDELDALLSLYTSLVSESDTP